MNHVRRGLGWFLLLSAAGLFTLFLLAAEPGEAWSFRDLGLGFLALASVLSVLDLVMGALRYHIFVRHLRPGTSLWLSFRTDLANRFTGAVTPSQTGGLPAQLFVLSRGGIPVADALGFLVINFLATLFFFLGAGVITTWIFRSHFSGESVRFLFQYGLVAFLAVFALMVVAVVRSDLIERPLERAVRRLEASRFAQLRRTAAPGRVLLRSAERYRHTCKGFFRERPHLVFGTLALTVLLYLNKFLVGWLLMRAMGVPADFVVAVGAQAILHFIIYFAPTPGGSGVGELSTGAIMAMLLPAHLLAPFTLLYRLLQVYLPAAVGGVVLFEEMRELARSGPRTAVATLGLLAALVLPVAGVAAAEAGAGPASPPGEAVRGWSSAPCPALLEGSWEAIRRGVSEARRERARERFAVAAELARQAVACEPDSARAHYTLAVAVGLHMETVGIRHKAALAHELETAAEAALAVDPDHAGAHHVLGRLHAGVMRMGTVEAFVARRILGADLVANASWSEAETHFTRARDLEPLNPYHSMELGALYLDTGRPGPARVELARAASLPPLHPEQEVAVERARDLLASLGAERR